MTAKEKMALLLLWLSFVIFAHGQGQSCDNNKGTCIDTTKGTCDGVLKPGLCPGPSNIICCEPILQDPDYYYHHWCGSGLQYLDDAYCAKKFPTSFDREWSCPVNVLSTPPSGYLPDGQIAVDTTALEFLVTSGANLCLILTKRIKSSESSPVNLYNKYYCAGNISATQVWETWSSSKIFAMANAAGHLRAEEPSCSPGTAGLDSFTTGKLGKTPLGDLATVVCSYDHTAGYSSNALSSYFHDMGWRQRLHDLVSSSWPALPPGLGAGLTLGGNYGEATPADLSLTLTTANGAAQCSAAKDPWPTTYANSLSALAAAEMTRRIVQHREVSSELRFPGADWKDIRDELYGPAESLLFPGLRWGGMSADTAVYLQSSLNMTDVELAASGRWRIFSKLGAGYSTSRSKGEIVSNAYACLPRFGASGASNVEAGGVEVVVAVRGSVDRDGSLVQAEAQVIKAMQQAIGAVMRGIIS